MNQQTDATALDKLGLALPSEQDMAATNETIEKLGLILSSLPRNESYWQFDNNIWTTTNITLTTGGGGGSSSEKKATKSKPKPKPKKAPSRYDLLKRAQ